MILDDLPVPYPPVDSRPWVPQGFASSEDGALLLTAFYNKDAPAEGLIALQPTDGSAVTYARVDDNYHYGGAAVVGEWLYLSGHGSAESAVERYFGISDGCFIQQYRIDELAAAAVADAEGPVVAPLGRVSAPVGAMATAHAGVVYVGEYRPRVPGALYSWTVGGDGALEANEEAGAPLGWVPPFAQGIVTDGSRWFAVTTTPDAKGLRSRDSYAEVVHFDPATGGVLATITDRAAPLSQGMIIRDGRFVVTNEGPSTPYSATILAAGMDPDPTLQEYAVPPAQET